MESSMANLLVLVLLMLLLESTIGTVPFQQCCPEDDKHLFIQNNNTCNSSQTLDLACNNDSEVLSFMKRDGKYWLRESDGSAIMNMASDVIGMVISHDSFCVANITLEYEVYKNGKKQHYDDGIVFCKETEPSGTYLGEELLSYAVFLLISGVGCFLTFLTYILVPALWKELLNKCLVHALLCFTFMYLLLGITLIELHWLVRRQCAYHVYITAFWAAAASFWTNVVSFHIWRTVVFERFPINEARLSKVYYFWGWGMPLILLLIATTLEAVPIGTGIGFALCPLKSSYALFIILVPPTFLLFFNLLYFIWTICKLWRQEVPSGSDLKFTKFQRQQYKCLLYLKLCLLMGIPWLVRFAITELPGNNFTQILFNTLTLLQGLFIFLLLVVFQKKAFLGLAEQFSKWGCPCPFVTTNVPVILIEEGNGSSKMETQGEAAKQANIES